MLKQIRIHNYKCFVDFKLDLPPLCVFVGGNGSGKTSLLEVLAGLQAVLVRNAEVAHGFPSSTLTRWRKADSVQRFGLDLQLGNDVFNYDIEFVHDLDQRQAFIRRERLECAGIVLYDRVDGNVDFLIAGDEPIRRIPYPRKLSFLPMLDADRHHPRAAAFRQAIANMCVFAPDPRAIDATTTREARFLERNGSNFVSWLRGVLADRPEVIVPLLDDLKPAMPGLQRIAFESISSTVRELMFTFHAETEQYQLSVTQLSDGQRMLLLLYGFLHGALHRPIIACIDEPETGLAPHEMQPWISAMSAAIEDQRGQAMVASHHPGFIDYVAASHTLQFRRTSQGPAVAQEVTLETTHGSRVSEWISRPWAYDDDVFTTNDEENKE